MTIVSNFNVWNTSIALVEKRGWKISTRDLGSDENNIKYEWIAKKGEFEVIGNSPIEMLGLISIYESQYEGSHEPYWWQLKSIKTWWEYAGRKI